MLVPSVAAPPVPERCWCGALELAPFSPEYRQCERCGTLVALVPAAPAADATSAAGLYGLDYFVAHAREMGHPTLEERARLDLPERCAFWLETLLRFRPPPARTLELGSANGAFVGLLAEAGYQATGLDLSAAVTRFARETFQVPVLTGRLEAQDLLPASLDVAILMDVLEHLPDPRATLDTLARLLAPEGVLLVQTPRVDPARTFEDLRASRDPFLAQLKPAEHLFLLSAPAAEALLAAAGFRHVRFVPAIFAQYDMCFVASRAPLSEVPAAEGRERLRTSRGGRIVEALVGAAADLRTAAADREERDQAAARARDAGARALRAAEEELRKARAGAAKLSEQLAAAQAEHRALVERLGFLARFFVPRHP